MAANTSHKPKTKPKTKTKTMATDDTKPNQDWSQDNLACRNTYTLLVGLKQLTEPFNKAGSKTMKQLAFWNAASSDTMRQLVAAGLGAQFDKFYIKVLLANYEDGFDFHSAIEDLKNTFSSADTTVSDLAQTINGIYHFRGE